jgi:hypothetical protein
MQPPCATARIKFAGECGHILWRHGRTPTPTLPLSTGRGGLEEKLANNVATPYADTLLSNVIARSSSERT